MMRVVLNRIWLSSFLLSLPLLSISGESGNRFISEWNAACSLGNKSFSIVFHSKTGGADNDDMEVHAVLPDGRRVRIPLPGALYVKRGVVSDVKNVCDNIGAVESHQDKVLLLISSDSRPGWDRLNLVYLDLGEGKVLDMEEQIGEIKDSNGLQGLTLRSRLGGFEVRLQREWLKNTGTDSDENSIEDWKFIEISNNKISTKWSR